MKQLFIIITIFFNISICHAQSLTSDTIVWSNKRLTFDDFQQNEVSDPRVNFVAKSRWLLDFRLVPIVDSAFKIIPIVRAEFFPKFSWIKARAIGNEDVLRHEQLHFDIVELEARILRKQLDGLVLNSPKSAKIARQFNRTINSELFKLQENYDLETNHGTDKSRQIWWTTNVFLQLQGLEKYAIAK